jgi:prepilin-type N-terminal cleavage/methylation domain-containing protein
MLPRLKAINGFTFVEVIAVLVILVIISSVIISRSSTGSTDMVLQTEILKTHIRYAQSMGMTGTNSDDVYGIKCNTSFYWMFKGTDPNINIVTLLDDQRYNTNNDGKLDLSKKKIDVSNPFTLFFDQRGIPYNSYTSETTNTPLPADFSFTITPDGEVSPSRIVTITQHTGFIP